MLKDSNRVLPVCYSGLFLQLWRTDDVKHLRNKKQQTLKLKISVITSEQIVMLSQICRKTPIQVLWQLTGGQGHRFESHLKLSSLEKPAS